MKNTKNNDIGSNTNKYFFDDNLDKTGQHYMIDQELIRYIVKSSLLKTSDIVLEIGYGTGVLTREISKKCMVIGIDIEGKCDQIKNSILVSGNILEKYWMLKEEYNFNKIVSNIPYNISEPLMRDIFKDDLELVVLTVGQKFSKIISSKDNRIGIISNDLFDVQVLKSVNPSAFNPRPKVDSSIIRLIPKKNSIYKKIVLLDDKKIKNIFESIFSKTMTKKDIKVKISPLGKLLDKNIYNLSNKEFIEFNLFISTLK